MRYSINGVFGEVDSLPGCSQIAVSHSVFVPDSLRGKGKGKLANKLRQEYFSDELGYDYTICTVADQNEAQIQIMCDNGWTRFDTFVSRKTGNIVHIFGKQL